MLSFTAMEPILSLHILLHEMPEGSVCKLEGSQCSLCLASRLLVKIAKGSQLYNSFYITLQEIWTIPGHKVSIEIEIISWANELLTTIVAGEAGTVV